MKKAFQITGGKGFHITFKNKVTVSVQFGVGSYVDKYPLEDIFEHQEAYMHFGERNREKAEKGTNTAEIAIVTPEKWISKEYTKGEEDVIGWQTPEDLVKILIWAQNYEK